MNTTTSRRIAAHYIYVHRKLFRNPILSLSSDGTVTGLSFADGGIDSLAGVEFYSGVLVPSLVNAHCHLELSYLKGALEEGGGFVGFAGGIGRARNAFSPQEMAAAVSFADSVMWKQGIGAVADISNDGSSFAAKRQSPIHYRTFLELFGLRTQPNRVLPPVAREAVLAGLEWSVTPHSTYSLSREAFAAAVAGLPGQTGGSRAPLSIHFMESPAEEELYRGVGPMVQWYASQGLDTDFTGYRSPAGRIIAQVPAERDIMLIHNCFATEEIVDTIESHFTGKVTWVLCPRSNAFISGVEPPYAMLRRKGVRIAVGTDSLASNRSLDPVEELKLLRGVPLEELLLWATAGGAEALGLQDIAAGFEPESRCGVVLIDGIDWETMSLTARSKSIRIV